MNKGGVFIISGPSGSGKDTVLAELFRNKPDLLFSISSITRPMRQGEKEGEKYNFISKEKFLYMIENDMLLEHNVFVENYYGTPREPVENAVKEGKDIIIEVDVNGAAQIREKLPEAVSIFIMPPSFDELKRRLKGRGTESEELIEKRLNSALGEIKRAAEYDYIIVNDNITAAADNILSVILSASFKTDRQKTIIDEVLSKC
ncbi:MAG: guanylate kinase [Acutalibacteraceae bacterium]|nr:guanylate kinase [Acutalibacteraceae bacterium]